MGSGGVTLTNRPFGRCHRKLQTRAISFLRIGLPYPHVCRKPVNAHKANTEMNKLASHESLRLHCVGESYGIFATHLAEDNTDSSLRIESLYDSSHVVSASLPPFRDYIA